MVADSSLGRGHPRRCAFAGADGGRRAQDLHVEPLELVRHSALAGVLPRYKFVAKAELFKVPVFGPAIRAIGMVPIERQNRKAAFGAYDVAAAKIQSGEFGCRVSRRIRAGSDYRIRPFKKGPFVLAIAAGVPIVPVLLHGTHDVFPKGSMLVRSGQVDIHLLEPFQRPVSISTTRTAC